MGGPLKTPMRYRDHEGVMGVSIRGYIVISGSFRKMLIKREGSRPQEGLCNPNLQNWDCDYHLVCVIIVVLMAPWAP